MLFLGACSWFTDFKQQPKMDPWETASDTIPFRGNPQGSVSVYGSQAAGFIYDRAPTPQAVSANHTWACWEIATKKPAPVRAIKNHKTARKLCS